jgi:hypothetical protein
MNIMKQASSTETSVTELNKIADNLACKDVKNYTKEDMIILKKLLKNPKTESKTLHKCIFDLAYKFIYTTTNIPSLKLDINKQFKEYTKLRLELKEHQNITSEMLEKFNSDLAIKYIRDKKKLEELALDDDPFIRTLTAHNKFTSLDTLNKLSYDTNDIVRMASLKHQKFTNEMLERLTFDLAIDINILVAKHLDATTEMLEKLVMVNDMNLDNAIENHHNANENTLSIINKRREDDFASLLGF